MTISMPHKQAISNIGKTLKTFHMDVMQLLQVHDVLLTRALSNRCITN